jgi:alcohol dehydrogenase class IV
MKEAQVIPFDFNLPTRILFGHGRIKELRSNLGSRSSNILIVTDRGVSEKSGALEKVLDQLSDLDVKVFDGVEENPTIDLMEKGRQFVRDEKTELIVGIGGGSPMDAAKGMAVLAGNDGSIKDYMGGRPLDEEPLPVVCIPTTSGTGSEVTPFAVFNDPDDRNKGGFAHPGIFPRFSIVDPELTFSMPESVVINTGLDALIHSIEAYLSLESFLMNDVLALHAVDVILENLKAAARKDRAAMSNLSYAAMLGGIAITNAGTVLLHIMAYPLTVYHDVPHGRANAALLPAFIRFMKEHSTVRSKVDRLEEKFVGAGGIEPFINGLGVSTRLAAYGVQSNELDTYADKTIKKGDVKITPARVTKEVIHQIYDSAM